MPCLSRGHMHAMHAATFRIGPMAFVLGPCTLWTHMLVVVVDCYHGCLCIVLYGVLCRHGLAEASGYGQCFQGRSQTDWRSAARSSTIGNLARHVNLGTETRAM